MQNQIREGSIMGVCETLPDENDPHYRPDPSWTWTMRQCGPDTEWLSWCFPFSLLLIPHCGMQNSTQTHLHKKYAFVRGLITVEESVILILQLYNTNTKFCYPAWVRKCVTKTPLIQWHQVVMCCNRIKLQSLFCYTLIRLIYVQKLTTSWH